MTTINMATFAIRNIDSSIDFEATCKKFEGELLKFEAERETELSTIAKAVATVFDKFPNAKFNMPALKTYTLQELNAQPENYKALEEKFVQYMKVASGDRENGAIYKISKGKSVNGGVCRWTDYKEPEAKK